MHITSVDERDSAWERDDARYRIYRFEGPDDTTSTFDLVDATVEDALDAARALSEDDEHLWALALVETDARGMRGLIWLSGMDYNDPPGSAQEWRRRRQMQSRYLMSKSRRGLPLTLPNGLRVIRMFPEWVRGWPLWEDLTDDYHLTGPQLGLSSTLSDALLAWNDAWCARTEVDPEPEGWQEDGLALYARLRDELDGIAEVRPEFLF